ncbi:MAG: AMP-binding protein [Bacteroidota bacterium]|nr:AMP-binding protein [Bacteroidota bacterium]
MKQINNPEIQSILNNFIWINWQNDEKKDDILKFCALFLNNYPEYHFKTSGSTGTPKLITFTKEQLLISAQASISYFELKPGMHQFICLDTNTIAGAMMLVRSLVCGMIPVITTPSAIPLYVISEYVTIDVASFTPNQLYAMLSHIGAHNFVNKLNQMHTILIGGAPINPALERLLESITAPTYHTYGMTETVSHIALRRLNGKEKQESFHCMPGVEIKLDERDCLMLKAPTTMGNWITTNDLAEILSIDQFLIKGRYDDIIISGGIKVNPQTIEIIIAQYFIKRNIRNRFFAYGIPDDKLGQKVVLYLEASESQFQNELADLKSYISDSLGKYLVPKEFIFIEKFKETISGKIDKIATIW